eukprot:s2009_g6.t1
MVVFPPLQPYNQWDPEAPESEGYSESGADDDGLIHDSNDFEDGPEEEEWFDQFVKGASEDSVAPTELDPATPVPSAPARENKVEEVKVVRPVARPLGHAGHAGPSSGSDVMMIEDSPVKLEVWVDPDETRAREKEEKAKKMQALRDELKLLEIQMERVLTRREQLGLAADMKAEKAELKGKGKGKGRAGGRGRGRGRGKVLSESANPETTPEKAKPTKRAPAAADTPEKRELFPDPPAPVTSSPAVKQPKKRIRGKAKAKCAIPEVPAASHDPVPDPVDEKPAPTAKAKAKSVAKPKAKPTAAEPENASSSSSEHKIGKATQKATLKLLKEMKGSDEAGWYHAKELYKALKFHKLSERKDVPKFDFWNLSMYWGTGRVGVLQKHQRGPVHLISFGGVHVKNIAMSAHAARMYATWHVVWYFKEKIKLQAAFSQFFLYHAVIPA